MIYNETYLDFSDVLIRPRPSELNSRREVSLEVSFKSWKGVPIFAANMDTIGTFSTANILSHFNCVTVLSKKHNVTDFIHNNYISNFISLSLGSSYDDYVNLCKIMDYDDSFKFITLDIANGYSKHFRGAIYRVRKQFPQHIIIAGNVATFEGCKILHEEGVDLIKIGIGSGSACTTRIMTGIGIPQFSCILECVNAGYNNIISDGGCTTSGDVAKAFGAGAFGVMLGGMLAGHDETGELFYGMSSEEAMNKYSNGVASYRAAEGRKVMIEKRGPLKNTIQSILGGLRSSLTYTNHRTLNSFIGNVDFVRVNNQYNKIFQ